MAASKITTDGQVSTYRGRSALGGRMTTPISIFYKETVYRPGTGSEAEWQRCESTPDAADPETVVGVYFCEWIGAYGSHLLTAQSVGVNESATVRTRFNPDVYTALRHSECVIYKGIAAIVDILEHYRPRRGDPDLWALWTGVDNVREENLFLEFKVRRYEGK
jgi:hypothetical protein